jgi:hypothetical protein
MKPRASTIATVYGANVVDEEEHPIRVAMDHIRDRALVSLPERIRGFIGCPLELVRGHDYGATKWVGGVRFVQKAGVVRCYGNREVMASLLYGCALLLSEVEKARESCQAFEPGPHLPGPVIPFLNANGGEETGPEGRRSITCRERR